VETLAEFDTGVVQAAIARIHRVVTCAQLEHGQPVFVFGTPSLLGVGRFEAKLLLAGEIGLATAQPDLLDVQAGLLETAADLEIFEIAADVERVRPEIPAALPARTEN